MKSIVDDIKGDLFDKYESAILSDKEKLANALKAQDAAGNDAKYYFHKDLNSKEPKQQKKVFYDINLYQGKAKLAEYDASFQKLQQRYNNAISIYELINSDVSGAIGLNKYYQYMNNNVNDKLEDISGLDLTNQRKAFYQNDYIENIKYYRSRFHLLYWILVVVFLGLFVKNQSYRSYRQIGLMLAVIAYPFVINGIMLNVLKMMEYLYRLTPANSYRNLFSQDINKTSDRDDEIFVHYSKVRDTTQSQQIAGGGVGGIQGQDVVLSSGASEADNALGSTSRRDCFNPEKVFCSSHANEKLEIAFVENKNFTNGFGFKKKVDNPPETFAPKSYYFKSTDIYDLANRKYFNVEFSALTPPEKQAEWAKIADTQGNEISTDISFNVKTVTIDDVVLKITNQNSAGSSQEETISIKNNKFYDVNRTIVNDTNKQIYYDENVMNRIYVGSGSERVKYDVTWVYFNYDELNGKSIGKQVGTKKFIELSDSPYQPHQIFNNIAQIDPSVNGIGNVEVEYENNWYKSGSGNSIKFIINGEQYPPIHIADSNGLDNISKYNVSKVNVENITNIYEPLGNDTVITITIDLGNNSEKQIPFKNSYDDGDNKSSAPENSTKKTAYTRNTVKNLKIDGSEYVDSTGGGTIIKHIEKDDDGNPIPGGIVLLKDGRAFINTVTTFESGFSVENKMPLLTTQNMIIPNYVKQQPQFIDNMVPKFVPGKKPKL